MVMTEVGTEKVVGRVTHVIIGYDATHGVDINKGILEFIPDRKKDLTRIQIPGSAVASIVQDLGGSSFSWSLRFLSDCRQAFFDTDVQVAAGNQYAMIDNGFSNKIEYFLVKVAIESAAGVPLVRTYTITNGYALRNRTVIGRDEDAEYVYEGEADYISYSDAAT